MLPITLTFRGLDELRVLQAVPLLNGKDEGLPKLLDNRGEASYIPPGGG